MLAKRVSDLMADFLFKRIEANATRESVTILPWFLARCEIFETISMQRDTVLNI